jgi:hypothetical protein
MKGIQELDAPVLAPERIRHSGGGRHSLIQHDPQLPALLEALVEPLTRGDPESPLRWTCKSTRTLADELAGQRPRISHEKVAQLLRGMDYSLQGNRKTEEGTDHPDRDAQFRHINRQVQLALRQGQPVISVDTKKKELIGNFENKGRQWRRQGEVEQVQDHDFPGPEVPRAYPYGIYDLARNTGFVNVGTDHDTASFAVASIRGWWREQWLSSAALEMGIAATGQPDGPGNSRLSLPSRDEQMEQSRTSAVFFHHFQLARRAVA